MKLKQFLAGAAALLIAHQSSGQATAASNSLTGTLPSSPNEFLGSSNAGDVIFKASNTEYMRMLAANGRIGIGTPTPVTAITLQTGSTNDGLRVIMSGTTAASLGLFNNSTNAHNYAMFSTGSGNSEGAGNFGIYDYTAGGYRMLISPVGYVGIGTGSTAPTSKLHVTNNYAALTGTDILGFFNATRSANGTDVGVKGVATAYYGAASAFNMGVMGVAQIDAGLISTTSNENFGVYGDAHDGYFNYAGYFTASASGTSHQAIGVYSTYSAGSGATGWAAYFGGSTFCTGTYQTSDRMLKDNIKPYQGAMDKIRQLKPSTYTYKTGQYKAMNLPEGQQIGLIAQDLEQVFPELVKEVKGFDEKDQDGKTTGTIPTFKSVNYTGLIPVLISAVQEQQKQLDEQKETIAMLKQQQDEMAAVKPAEGVLADVRLYQNEPNPFGQETTIRYNLPEQVSSAYIAVYDLSGKQLLTLPLSQKGAGAVTLSSNKLSAGIYIYSIVADNKVVDSKRMVLTDK